MVDYVKFYCWLVAFWQVHIIRKDWFELGLSRPRWLWWYAMWVLLLAPSFLPFLSRVSESHPSKWSILPVRKSLISILNKIESWSRHKHRISVNYLRDERNSYNLFQYYDNTDTENLKIGILVWKIESDGANREPLLIPCYTKCQLLNSAQYRLPELVIYSRTSFIWAH